MRTGIRPLLVAAASTLTLAGCGGSSPSSSISSAASSSLSAASSAISSAKSSASAAIGGSGTTTATSSTAAPTSSSAGSSATSSLPSGGAGLVGAVNACKQGVAAAPNLSASLRKRLATICKRAGTGDVAGAKQAAGQLCQEIIQAQVPASARSEALANCPKQ